VQRAVSGVCHLDGAVADRGKIGWGGKVIVNDRYQVRVRVQ